MLYYRSKGSEELFKEWRSLTAILADLSFIVQNPIHISFDDLNAWNASYVKARSILGDLADSINEFVTSQPIVDDPSAKGYDGQ